MLPRIFVSLFLILVVAHGVRPLQAASTPALDQPPVIPVIDRAMKAELRNIYLIGTNSGNRPGVFAKVGDSITRTRFYLKDIGCSVEVLAGHRDLAPTIDFFRIFTFPDSFTTAWCGIANSFSRDSFTADNGWTALEPLTRFNNPHAACPFPDDNPLRCEMRVIKPSIAIIMLGTNDLEENNPETFRSNLRAVVQETMIVGVVPVLSTIPPRLDSPEMNRRVAPYNQIIREIAGTLQVPLWNYWLILQSPGMIHQGMDKFGIHPNVFNGTDPANFSSEGLRYGMNQRNYTAVQVLKKLKAIVENNAAPDVISTPNLSVFPDQYQPTVVRGNTVDLTIKIGRNNLADPVLLSLDSPPEGISGKFKLNNLKTAATLTLTVLRGVPPSIYRITVRGRSGTIRRSTTFALKVTK